MKKHNLHVHTKFSDGINSPEEMIEQARWQGLEVLGISDHGFTRKTHSLYGYNLSSYIDYLRKLKSESKHVDVKIGIEIDFCLESGCYPQLLPFEKLNELDYILFEYVDEKDSLNGITGRALEVLVETRKKLLVPVGLAHSDMQASYSGRENEISGILGANDIFVEVSQTLLPGERYGGRNTRIGMDYYRHFSNEMIGALRRNGVRFVVGTDNHDTRNIGQIYDAVAFLIENGLEVHPIAC